MKSNPFKLFLLFISLLFSNFIQAQSSVKEFSSMGIHYWQRWEGSTFRSHNYGLTYSYLVTSKIELYPEVGLNYRPKSIELSEIFLTSYIALGGRFYPLSKNNFSIESQFLYDVKKPNIEDKNSKWKIGIGYAFAIKKQLFINLNYGLIINSNTTLQYSGVTIFRKF